ncbi:MAG: hypothetical protein ACRCSB_01680, partial [Bacteroidales bacterium]
ITLSQSKKDIRELLPLMLKNKKPIRQGMYDFKRDPTKAEKDSKQIYGGLPLKDERRSNKKTYGSHLGEFIGFMDDNTPVRLAQDSLNRMSNQADKVWFRMDITVKDVNKAKCLSVTPDQKGYCAYDLESAKATFTWFVITKVINGRYPLWANQYDIWQPELSKINEKEWYSLCIAYILAENRCIETKFEADNPVVGAPEILVHNPLSMNNSQNFWGKTLSPYLRAAKSSDLADNLVQAIQKLYQYWATAHCKGQVLYHVGLENEPYFKYFDYPDYLTVNAGLIQIRKYAEIHQLSDLQSHFEEISSLTKQVRERLWEMLTVEMGYFE